jgi:chaperonin GroEL
MGTQRRRILEDLATITGGRCISPERGERLEGISIDALGKARQAWATRAAFGILGGYGSKADIRQRIAQARAELGSTPGTDQFTTSKIRERIGKLAGMTAIVRVGAPSTSEQSELKLRVEAAVRSARSALRDGVVAGGGAALLACRPALEAVSASGDQAVGLRALARALAAPMRVILANAGLEPDPVVARAAGSHQVYDVLRRRWVDPFADGLVDPLAVQLAALEASVSAAVQALTTEVLIHRQDAPTVVNP